MTQAPRTNIGSQENQAPSYDICLSVGGGRLASRLEKAGNSVAGGAHRPTFSGGSLGDRGAGGGGEERGGKGGGRLEMPVWDRKGGV